jgi:hypothetical protein
VASSAISVLRRTSRRQRRCLRGEAEVGSAFRLNCFAYLDSSLGAAVFGGFRSPAWVYSWSSFGSTFHGMYLQLSVSTFLLVFVLVPAVILFF